MDRDGTFTVQLHATRTRTQVELAAYLGIRQSSISCAKRRANIPAEWLLTLLLNNNVNPVWILSGKGQQYLDLSVDGDEDARPVRSRPKMLQIVRQLPARLLADELVRRIAVTEKGGEKGGKGGSA